MLPSVSYACSDKRDAQGGILFAVVGAKLSEGINFADDMARGEYGPLLPESLADLTRAAVIICGASQRVDLLDLR